MVAGSSTLTHAPVPFQRFPLIPTLFITILPTRFLRKATYLDHNAIILKGGGLDERTKQAVMKGKHSGKGENR